MTFSAALRALGMMTVLATGGCGRFGRPVAEPGFAPTAADAAVQTWLTVADVHFDPFGDAPLVRRLAAAEVSRWPALLASQAAKHPGGYGADTTPALWLSTLRAVHRAAPRATVVFVPGDLLAHDFTGKYEAVFGRGDRAGFERFVRKTSTYLAYSLHAAVPGAQMLPAIGNNDGSCGDYAIAPRSAYLAAMARVWAPLVNVAGRAPDFVRTFADGGYYVARLPLPRARVVVPNSVFWSRRYGDECVPAGVRPGDEQLAWFRRTLIGDAAHDRTWVATHIPPGIDVVYTFLHLGDPVMLLRPEAQAAMLAAIDDPRANVVMMLTGHLHQTGFRRTRDGDGRGAPVLVAPSISPVFGNAPSFLVLSVSPASATVVDFRAFELHDFSALHATPTWRNAYAFAQAYGEPEFTLRTLADIHAREERSRSLRSQLAGHAVSGGIVRLLTRLDWRSIRCAETALSSATYVACRQAGGAAPTPRATPITSSAP